ncbi:hypothetical protein AUEXF2481DRAFT_34834, partial [Aureobasidium subglaciale EXF-2481]
MTVLAIMQIYSMFNFWTFALVTVPCIMLDPEPCLYQCSQPALCPTDSTVKPLNMSGKTQKQQLPLEVPHLSRHI